MLAAAWSTWVLVVAVLVCSPGRDVAVSAVPVPNPDPEIVSDTRRTCSPAMRII